MYFEITIGILRDRVFQYIGQNYNDHFKPFKEFSYGIIGNAAGNIQ